MLTAMYHAWAQAEPGVDARVLSAAATPTGGLRHATLRVAGTDAYRLLKGEHGVHRLSRISPFSQTGQRHTSFASVDVTPELPPPPDFVLDKKRLRTDTCRSQGAGGQHVNVTDSAVRLAYTLEDGTRFVVSCQNERSQRQNHDRATAVLLARIRRHLDEQVRKTLREAKGEKKPAAFAHHLRTYVLSPYQTVKDHRSGLRTTDAAAIVSGKRLRDFLDTAGTSTKGSPQP